jgi:glycosyltransferase involved in cell wall biosynthesis
MNPLVSVLLPFRDAGKTLGETLESLLAQSEARWELVAVNDHSHDDSPALITRLARTDRRIRLLHNPAAGLVSALNLGLVACHAPLVARMDADDIMAPERLAAQLRHFRDNPRLTLSASRVALFPEERIQAGLREYIRWQNRCLSPREIARELYVESPFAHPSVMFRKDRILALGGYRHGTFPEDYDLWLRLFHAGHHMEKLSEVLLHWREHSGRLSRTDPRCSRSAFDRLRARYLARDSRLLTRRNNFVIWGAGRKTRRRADHLLARGFRPRAWIDIDPRKIGNYIEAVPVVGPEWLPEQGCPFVLVYVANHGAREEIMETLEGYGYQPGRDCLAVG